MIKKKKIVFIFPTYNESGNIVRLLDSTISMFRELSNYESSILIVDDNSPDGTADLVRNYQKKYKNVFLLNGVRNGLGFAMIRGIKYCLKELHPDFVILNEADMTYLPSDSVKMVKLIEKGNDVVAAARVLKDKNSWPIDRRIMHWASNELFAKTVAGVKEIDDHNCAFRAIRVNKVLDTINFDDFPKGFSFFNYLAFKLSLKTKKIINYKVIYYPRTVGESKISFKPRHIKNLLNNFYEYIISCINIRYQRIFGQ